MKDLDISKSIMEAYASMYQPNKEVDEGTTVVEDLEEGRKFDIQKGDKKRSITKAEWDTYQQMGWKKVEETLGEGKSHASTADLMKLAKDLNNRDSRAIQTLAGKIDNYAQTGSKSTMLDLGKYFNSLDKESQKSVSTILQKHDSDLLKSIKIKEEKLDPVGKEDDDIDNDGDVDDSDEYLAKRRKAISKSIKKEKSCDSKKKAMTEVEEPRAQGEKDFKDKHVVAKHDKTPK